MCDHARCPADRYVLINAPLPHSPGAITAIIAGPCIFFRTHAHGVTHTEEEKQKKKDKKMKKKEMKKKTTKADARGDYSPPLSNDRMSARARLARLSTERDCARPRNAITSRYSSVLSLAIIGK